MQLSPVTLDSLQGAVVLVGSMLSADRRTGLPNGTRVSDRITERIVRGAFLNPPVEFGVTPSMLNEIERLVKQTPFEVLFEHYPEPGRARDLLAAQYVNGCPNPFHFGLTKAIRQGNIAHIVTTNYDLCIESAAQPHDGLRTVVEPADLVAPVPSPSIPPTLFKIHGCASRPDSLVFRLSQEGALPQWKRDLLAELVDGRDLVVIGYSGRDFDICPILFGLPYRRLFWLFRGTNPLPAEIAESSYNLQHVYAHPSEFDRVHATGGGFDALFSGLVDPSQIHFEPSVEEAGIVADLFVNEAADPYGYMIWRAALLNAVSCRFGTLAALSQLAPNDRTRPEAVKLASDADERGGRYKDSIKRVRLLREVLDRSRDPDRWLESFFVEAGRFYTAGDFIRFYRAKKLFRAAAARLVEERVSFDGDLDEARAAYLDVLWLKALRLLPVIGKWVAGYAFRSRNAQDFERAANFYYRTGGWQELHLIQAAMNDLGLPIAIGGSAGADAHLLLATASGFGHLNNLVGRAAAYRRSLNPERATCNELLDGLAAFGHSAEFWKFFRRFRSIISRRHYRTYRSLARSELRQCQYSLVFKLKNRLGGVLR